MANPSLQIGNSNWAIKEDNLLGYSTAGTRFVPQPITMTRASAGTIVNPSGLVEDVALLGSELVTNGDFTTDSDWDKTGTWSIESNYATANANSTSQYIQQDFTITNGKTYLFTYEIIENTLNGNGSSLSGSGGFVSVSLSSVIGTHQVYITADDSGAVYALKIGVSGTATTGTIKLDNVSVKEATIDNLPRVDYTDGTSSLLVEPQRTNLIPYSEDFSNSYWSKLDGLTVSSLTGGLSPDGLTNSDIITINNGRLNKDISVSNSTAYTLTAYFKGTVGETINMDLGASTRLITLTGLWQRESINLTTTSTFIAVNLIDNRSTGTASTVEVWGAQLEEGSYATSYIPTDGSTVTRVQDQYSKTGISNLINSEEGVLFVEWKPKLSSDYSFISINNGSITDSVIIGKSNNTTNMFIAVRSSNVYQALYTSGVYDFTIFNKVAVKWKLNDISVWINGTESTNWSSGSSPVGLSKLSFDFGNGTENFYGKVKQLQVFKTALTDTELATLTS